MIINVGVLDQIIDYAKMTKGDINYLYDGKIMLGVDYRLGMMKMINLPIPLENITACFSLNELTAMRKNILPIDRIDITNEYIKDLDSISSNEIKCYKRGSEDIMETFIRVSSSINIMENFHYDKIYEYGNIRGNEAFENVLSNKAADGTAVFSIDNRFSMILFPALFPINKGDEAYLTIYDENEYSFITKFSIKKKKNIIIDIFIRFLHV